MNAILESKGMGAIFQKKGKKYWKKAKYLKTWAKMYRIWIYLEKGKWLRAIIERNKLLE